MEFKTTEQYPARASVQAKRCSECQKDFKTMNDTIWHIVEHHPIIERRKCGRVELLCSARKPFSKRERSLMTEWVVLVDGEVIKGQTGWQAGRFAEGVAWAIENLGTGGLYAPAGSEAVDSQR